ncbi:hypothetical protein M9458_033658, partial [Cirrhinus mrigala]
MWKNISISEEALRQADHLLYCCTRLPPPTAEPAGSTSPLHSAGRPALAGQRRRTPAARRWVAG